MFHSVSLPVPAPESSSDDVSGNKQVDLRDDHSNNAASDSPATSTASKRQSPDNKDSSGWHNLDNYADIGLGRDSSPSLATLELQQQAHDMSGFLVCD